MSYPPTAKQQAILRYVAGFIEARGESPTLRTIARALGFASHTSVVNCLRGIEERGLIRREHSRQRAIELLRPVAIPRSPTGEPLHFVSVP